MSRVRYEIEADIVTMSPLHVGSGHKGALPTPVVDKNDKAPDVALVLRDINNRPVISGSTLKGLIRRIAEGRDFNSSRLASLLGTINDDGTGRLGFLTVYAAVQTEAGNASGLPYADRTVEKATFVASRTRIDRATGTAAANKLYFQEMVPAGSRFRLRLAIDTRAWVRRDAQRDEILGFSDDTQLQSKAAWDDLHEILSEMATSSGHALGKGQADGQGRVRLDPRNVSARRFALDTSGRFAPSNIEFDVGAAHQRAVHVLEREVALELLCEGPFTILDSSHGKKSGSLNSDKDGVPNVRAQRSGDGPLVMGSSITGPLRAKAAWLLALQRHRSGQPVTSEKTIDDPDADFATRGSANALTPVERLFGITGFRGLMEVREVKVLASQPWKITSVKLDRLSGAPIDGALFTTETFVGTRIALSLALRNRGSALEEADTLLFDELIAGIRKNGIELGHGSNKGFGWFEVVEP